MNKSKKLRKSKKGNKLIKLKGGSPAREKSRSRNRNETSSRYTNVPSHNFHQTMNNYQHLKKNDQPDKSEIVDIIRTRMNNIRNVVNSLCKNGKLTSLEFEISKKEFLELRSCVNPFELFDKLVEMISTKTDESDKSEIVTLIINDVLKIKK